MTVFNANAGDGRVGRVRNVNLGAWSVVRAAANGTDVNDTATTMALINARYSIRRRVGQQWQLYRLYLSFDTGSVIPAGAVIDSAILTLNQTVSGTTGSEVNVFVTEHTVTDETNLATADYNNYVALNSAAQAGPPWSSVGTGTKTSVFTSVGFGFIKGTGEASSGGGTAGFTKIMLRGENDYSNIDPIHISNIIEATYSTSESANPPTLTVIFASPAAAIFMKGKTLDIKGGTVDLRA